MKILVFISGLILMIIPCKAQSVVINEICYSNDHYLEDEQDDYPDWFELYNSSEVPVDLTGYQATDDTSKSVFWEFPSVTIGAGDYVLIFASGKDTLLDTQIHTSFQLANMKETLYLINKSGEIIDFITPACVPKNHSLARQPDGAGTLNVIVPTPAFSNDLAEIVPVNFVPDTLTVNYQSGFYDEPITVSFSHRHPGNSILYTLDGEDPDDDDEVYVNPVFLEDITSHKNRFANKPETFIEPGNMIFKANILRAVVYSNGCPASNEISNTYFIGSTLKGNYTVPVVSLITEEDHLFDDEEGIYVHGKYRNFDQHGGKWERPVHVEIFDSAGLQVIDQDAGMRIHGRGSRRSPQKSLRLYAEEEYGNKYFEYPLFSQKPDLNRFRVLLLRTTGGTLGSLFKEELCNHLVQNMNIDYPAGETAILFINGEYWGIYNLMERQNVNYLENNYDLEGIGADIIAYDRQITVEEGSIDAYNSLLNELLSGDPSDSMFYRELNEKIDLEALTDYYIAQLYFANADWPASNVELWKIHNDTSRWRYFFFDSDASMSWINDDHITEYNNNIADYQRYDHFSTVILKTLMNNEEFRKKFYNRYYLHLASTFRSDKVLDAIDHFERIYAPLVPEQVYRWHNPVDYAKWNENVEWLRTYAIQRPLIVSEQLQRNFGHPVRIYPNPSAGIFNIQLDGGSESIIIKIFTLKGELLSQQVQSGDAPVTINSGLLPGVYIVQVISDFISSSSKLVIK